MVPVDSKNCSINYTQTHVMNLGVYPSSIYRSIYRSIPDPYIYALHPDVLHGNMASVVIDDYNEQFFNGTTWSKINVTYTMKDVQIEISD